MAESEHRPEVVADAGPIIHLDELSALEILSDFAAVLVPDAVKAEVARYRPKALKRDKALLIMVTVEGGDDPAFVALAQALTLGAGEQEAILLAQRRSLILLTDDAAARLAAESLGLQAHGTIGVLIRAVRRGQRTPQEILVLLQKLPELSSLHLRPEFLAEVLQHFKDEFGP